LHSWSEEQLGAPAPHVPACGSAPAGLTVVEEAIKLVADPDPVSVAMRLVLELELDPGVVPAVVVLTCATAQAPRLRNRDSTAMARAGSILG